MKRGGRMIGSLPNGRVPGRCAVTAGAGSDHTVRVLSSALLLFLVVGCGSDVVSSEGTRVASVSVLPDEQTTEVGEAVVLEAVVEDADGNTLSGRQVFWSSNNEEVAIVSGDGRVTGRAPGTVEIAASTDGKSGVSTVTVERKRPARLQRSGGDSQEGIVGQRLPDVLAVRVTDDDGDPVRDVRVKWNVDSGAGSVDPATSETDGEGVARTQWTLGTGAGPQSAMASLPDSPGIGTVSFAASALPDVVSELVKVSRTGNLAGTAGEPLDDALAVRAVDRHENTVRGVRISWSGDSGGSFSPGTSETDGEGIARTEWTLPTRAGKARATASMQGISNGVTFDVTVGPAAPAAVEIVSGDDQRERAFKEVDDPLEVRVVDGYDNPVPDYTVTWSIPDDGGGGSLDPNSTVTDASGTARTEWTLGFPGCNRAIATVGEASATFTATATFPFGDDDDDDDDDEDDACED